MNRFHGLLFIGLGISLPLWADSFTIEGKTYDNVYVVETGAMYYVHFPDTGKVSSVAKNNVSSDALRLTSDAATRKALRERWNASNDRLRGSAAAPSPPSALPKPAVQAPPPRQPAVPRLYVPVPNSPHVTDGMVRDVKMEGVPLGQALKGIMRPLNLDYKVEGDYLWVSTPEKLRTESMETPETRVYPMKSAAGESLPKLLVGNPGGAAQAAAGGNFGGATGGFATPGAPGFGGGASMGGGTTGFGGGGGMGMGGGATFSNISQLFSTIDDRSVGEPPAVIGLGQATLQGGGNANYAAHNGLRSTQEPLQE